MVERAHEPAGGVRHLLRVDWHPTGPVDLDAWPCTVPCIAALIRAGGLDIPGGVTFLVGENGSGKSTLVEALAGAYPRRGGLLPG
jgi:predicted ATPase